MLAKVVNDDAGKLMPSGVLGFFASKLAPTVGCDRPLHVQCMPQGPQRRFLYRFAEGWVGVNRARHVFQA